MDVADSTAVDSAACARNDAADTAVDIGAEARNVATLRLHTPGIYMWDRNL